MSIKPYGSKAGKISEIARSFKAKSLVNGNIVLVPVYRKDCGGVLSRLALAKRIEAVLNKEAKRK